MTNENSLNELVRQAKEGSQTALEALIRAVQDRIYNLALRMLWNPNDAQDATQEILIKVITHLSDFREESAFTTWVYRIATNYLLTTRKRRAEKTEMTFEKLGGMLDAGMAMPDNNAVDDRVLVEEVKISCTLGMLLCLDREHRITYILGGIFQVSSEQGAYLTDTTPVAYRKRLSRARQKLKEFMNSKCGLINPANPCRCSKQVNPKIKFGLLKPDRLFYADKAVVQESIDEMHKLDRIATLFRSHPNYDTPEDFTEAIRQLLAKGEYQVFNL
jgi:RNA polymerase sigma factor (sigma-70 family)